MTIHNLNDEGSERCVEGLGCSFLLYFHENHAEGIVVFVLSALPLYAQGTLTITTEKPSYSYGETIEVRLSLANNTDSTFTLYGSSTCFARIGMNDVPFVFVCTADMRAYTFAPGVTRTWVWLLEPARYGIPDRNGTQVLRGHIAGRTDSIFIQAPKYYGGRISVGIQLQTSESEMRSLRDSVNATVINRYVGEDSLVSETWQIIGKSVDSLATVLNNDYRLRWVVVERVLQFEREIVTSVPSTLLQEKDFILYQNYPNPFNPETTISYEVPVSSWVSLRIFNVLGQEIATLIDDKVDPGRHQVQWNAEALPSGVYLYRLEAGNYVETKKMLLAR